VNDLTEAEVDQILAKFDRTHPDLQRRIVLRFVVTSERFRAALHAIIRLAPSSEAARVAREALGE
jgi:hypothetical protein